MENKDGVQIGEDASNVKISNKVVKTDIKYMMLPKNRTTS
jgi:hypothetical protein